MTLLRPSVTVPALLLAVACASASGRGEEPAVPEGIDPRVRTWQDVMELVMEEQFHGIIEMEVERGAERADLDAIAGAARTAARHLALGYGSLEQDVPEDFARRCRRAESWLLGIAEAAEQGRAAAVAEDVPTGFERHCQACHDEL